jgi:hypothetical protein
MRIPFSQKIKSHGGAWHSSRITTYGSMLIPSAQLSGRIFPRTLWNADTIEAGRDALGFYHEKKDEARNIGLGPEQRLVFACVRCVWLAGGRL